MALTRSDLDHLIYNNGLLLTLDGADNSTSTKRGYRKLTIKGVSYLLHRLIFLYHFKYLPKVIDHVDGSVSNNKIENLQNCSQSKNISKSKLFNTNTTGFKGVSYHKVANKYEAYFTRNYIRTYVGLYETASEAFKARENYLKGKYGNQV